MGADTETGALKTVAFAPAKATRPLGAQISHMLKQRGVDVIFGIPGVHNIELYRGIEEAGITHVLARHEQGAGFMADGYARASGKPGVAYVITGPGLCNIMTPMGQAYSDSVSMLVLSSCLDDTAARRGQLHQMLDQRAAAATVCDWSEEAHSAQAAFGLIDRALAEFGNQRQRPKHIQVPIDLLGQQSADAPTAAVPVTQAAGLQDGVALGVAKQLRQAQKPLFIFGGGVVRAGASAIAGQLLEASGAAAFCSYAAGGVLAPDEPMSFGCTLGRADSARVLGQADLVVVIGCELSECDLWRNQLGHAGRMLRVDIDPQVLADEHRADEVIRADAGDFLQAVLSQFDCRVAAKWDAVEIARVKARWRQEIDADRPGIAPLCAALAGIMPQDAMIFSDMTQFAYVAKELWDMPQPGHWHHPSGFGTLGYALPAAIGGAVARPGLPTLCIAGDYGFQYSLQDLGTAVELGLPIPILLWDNAKLKEIEDAMVNSQIAPNAVVAQNPDFMQLAAAYGAYGETPQTVQDLQAAVLSALTADAPTLIRMTPELTA